MAGQGGLVGEATLAEATSLSGEFRLLQMKFSTGVRLNELKSIAQVLALLANVKPPTRDMNRHHSQLMRWYSDNWEHILPCLPMVHLCDQQGMPIDGNRELVERKLNHMISESKE
jgi:hypothetical protein